jgi:hypothetical protein
MVKANRPIPAANSIKLFFHCSTCIGDRPADQSPSEWCSIEAGWTTLGLQVRCKRCDLNIVHIDFEGRKHPANTHGTELAP